jgi:hypothetical protein
MPRDLELRRSGDFKPFQPNQFEQIFSSDVCFRGVAIEITTDAVRYNTELQPPMGHQAYVGFAGELSTNLRATSLSMASLAVAAQRGRVQVTLWLG